jgi:hypothetical protein
MHVTGDFVTALTHGAGKTVKQGDFQRAPCPYGGTWRIGVAIELNRGTERVIDLADARCRRRIRRSIAEAAASGNTADIRERRIRAAAFSFACDGALERHAELAIYDENCPADTEERDPATVARIVLGLPWNKTPTPVELRIVFGVDAPSSSDAARFVVETGGDLYCRLHGVQCDS